MKYRKTHTLSTLIVTLSAGYYINLNVSKQRYPDRQIHCVFPSLKAQLVLMWSRQREGHIENKSPVRAIEPVIKT